MMMRSRQSRQHGQPRRDEVLQFWLGVCATARWNDGQEELERGAVITANHAGKRRSTMAVERRRKRKTVAGADYIDPDKAARPPAPACDVSRRAAACLHKRKRWKRAAVSGSSVSRQRNSWVMSLYSSHVSMLQCSVSVPCSSFFSKF